MHKISYSIVIPAHNSSKFIESLLLSIPDRDDVEAIVVDDHSSDFLSLKSIVDNYKFARLMQNSKGQGAGNARQVGLESAVGRWILFADSDDRFSANFNDVLDTYVDQDAEIVLFIPRAEMLGSGLRSSRCDYYHYLFNQNINNKISNFELSYRLTNIWSKMYRRESIINIHFEDTLIANDVKFAAQAAFHTRKKIIVDKHNPMYVLTERIGSITKTKGRRLSKYLTRTKIRMVNDAWVRNQLRKVGEAPIHIRRYESLLRRFLTATSYNEEKRGRWTFNPIKTILRLGAIAKKTIFGIIAKPFLNRHTKQNPGMIEEVDVVYCVDENVVDQSLVSLVSLLENNNIVCLNVHYVYANLSTEDISMIKGLKGRYKNVNFIFHKIDAQRLEGLFSRKYTKITPIGYGRFLLADILPDKNKILYLDTDVVCMGDIADLWRLDLDDNFAAAAAEYPSWYASGMTRNQGKARLFIARKNEMINSGVMLFNLDYIRKEKVVDRLFKTDKLIINRMNQDQDIYNVVFEEKMLILPAIYNMTTTTYAQNLIKIFNTVFVHYTGPSKPWNKKAGIKRVLASFDLRLPYYTKYEKVLKNEI